MESANATSWAAFLARGFFVNTVGRDEEAIRAYIRNQEKEDQRLEQIESLALTGRLWAAPNSRGRVSDPFCRFERLRS